MWSLTKQSFNPIPFIDRKPLVDHLTAFTLYLVILGHFSGLPLWLQSAIFTFHMPLFVLLSGYLLSPQRLSQSPGKFLADRVHRLLVPYFLMGVLSFIPAWLFFEEHGWSLQRALHDSLQMLKGLAYGIGDRPLAHNIPLWFLPCLFLIQILFYPISCFSSKYLPWGVLILLGVLGWSMRLWLPWRPPWSLDSALLALPFFVLGYALRTVDFPTLFNTGFKRWGAAGAGLVAYSLAIFFNGSVDMNGATINNPILYYSGALGGILLWSMLLLRIPPLIATRSIAQHGLLIFGFHILGMAFVRGVLIHTLDLDPLFHEGRVGILLAMSLAVLVLTWLGAIVLQRWFPVIAGEHSITPQS